MSTDGNFDCDDCGYPFDPSESPDPAEELCRECVEFQAWFFGGSPVPRAGDAA